METNGIDLTKYDNLQFKAVIDGSISVGTIMHDNGHFVSLTTRLSRHYLSDDAFLRLIKEGKTTINDTAIRDFEIVPRDSETYKDWQVGDRATDPNEKWNDSAYKEIIFRSGELVICKDGNGDISGGYTCGQLHRLGYRLVLTDIEKQIIEERKKAKWKPQDGDICYAELISDWVFIKKDGEFLTENYAALKLNDGYTNFDNPSRINNDAFVKMIRIATEGEKQKLFDAMEKKGKRWNAEKKVVEDIPKPYEFKKGEPVLVRDNGCVWKIGVFTKMRADYFQYGAMTNGLDECGYHFCIPYNERTMHLLGTLEDYKEE